MKRTLLAVIAATAFIGIAASPGCKTTGVGDPCIPEQEYDPTFNGFDPGEVSVESKSFQCETRLCLVNHFRGRVTCAYGQDSTGTGTGGATEGCAVPGTYGSSNVEPITGAPNNPVGGTVDAQCIDRTANDAVYCSCRCANTNGQTNDGANYCKCPDGFACTQLVTSTGMGNEGLTGAYCVKNGTGYDPNTSCGKGGCDESDPSTTCSTGSGADYQK